MLIVVYKSTHEENLSEFPHTNNKQYKKSVTFLTGYIGSFNDASKKIHNKSVFEGAENSVITYILVFMNWKV